MKYITAKEAGEKWGLGIRMVALYCTGGRIAGAIKKGNLWLIPEDAVKPGDRRRKKITIQEKQEASISKDTKEPSPHAPWPFQSLYENKDLFIEIVKHLPYPMHICAPDGTILLANEAYLKFAKITNPEKLYMKHNILQNPNLEKWGIKDFTVRAFQGEAVSAYDVKVPHQEIIERLGDDKNFVCGSMYQNMTALPIRDSDNRLLYIVFIFITSRYYQDREEIMKGKEYIDDHWREDFDINKLANTVHMSKYHYTRLFKQHTGMTPYNYYQNVKLGKLKEMLCDSNLSITQVFDKCGMNYNGKLAKKLKNILGMTPSQYRTMMNQK